MFRCHFYRLNDGPVGVHGQVRVYFYRLHDGPVGVYFYRLHDGSVGVYFYRLHAGPEVLHIVGVVLTPHLARSLCSASIIYKVVR